MSATYGYPYPQPPVPGYFNANYMPLPQQQQFQQSSSQPVQQGVRLTQVPDELTALNAQFPMDGSPVFFINSNGQEIYSKQLSLSNGSVIFKKFREVKEAKPEAKDPGYVTHAEMNQKLEEIYNLLGAVTAPASVEGSERV